jgi:TraM recognition site of TraD and TraG
MTVYDLDATLIKWGGGEDHSFTLGQAMTGVVGFGATGSGKTSGYGNLLRTTYLTPSRALPEGMGGLVLCAKTSERAEWVEAVRKAGRMKNLYIFGGPEGRPDARFDPWEWLGGLGRAGAGQVISAVLLLSELSQAAEHATGMEAGGKGSGESAYFIKTLQHFLTGLVSLILTARLPLTINTMRELAASAPQTAAELATKEWQQSPLAQLLAQLAAEHTDVRDSERRADIEELFRFWTGDWPRLSLRPKSIVETMWATMISAFLHAGSPLRSLFTGGGGTVRPEDCFDGRIVIVDVPIQEFKAVGSIAAHVWKHCFQKAVMRRSGPRGSLRPTFLWADEFQNFVSEGDAEYQAVARGSGGCTVYLTQQIQSLSRVLGEDTTENLLANLQTKFFAQNSGKTNEWASNLIGSRYVWVMGTNTGGGTHDTTGIPTNNQQAGTSRNEQLRPYIQPSRFLTLRNGTPLNNYEVDSVVFAGGKSFKGPKDERAPFKILTFRQERE